MIVEKIIEIGLGIVQFFFSWLDLPEAPIEITAPIDFLIATINYGITLLAYIYTPVLFIVLVTVAIGLLAFDQIYFFTMYIIRKIPFLNIR